MDDEQQEQMVLVRSSFPVTGQPIRVVMIDGEPWFVTKDVCAVLDRGSPSWASKMVSPDDTRTIDMRSVCLSSTQAYDVSAGGNGPVRGNPLLNVVSEAGLYLLVMRSRKPSAQPFQEWVTHNLLPSIRSGNADIPTQQRRMAETLAEAIGQQVQIIAEIDHEDWPGLTVHSDGTFHCRHGEMVLQLPSREEDSGPPFGAYFACPGGERVGIRGSRIVPGCPKLKLVDLVRIRREPQPEPIAMPEPGHGLVFAEVKTGPISRVYGAAPQIAELIRECSR